MKTKEQLIKENSELQEKIKSIDDMRIDLTKILFEPDEHAFGGREIYITKSWLEIVFRIGKMAQTEIDHGLSQEVSRKNDIIHEMRKEIEHYKYVCKAKKNKIKNVVDTNDNL